MSVEFRDYYEVLGVERTASADEIKRAFRKLARKHHPDASKDEDGAEARFKEINEAYEVLSDPEKREKYDLLGENWEHGAPFSGYPGGGGGGGAFYEQHFDDGTGFSSFFEQMFGRRAAGGDPFGGAYQQRARGPRKGRDIESDILVSLDEIMNGGERQLRMQGSDGETKTFKVKIPRGITEGKQIRLAGLGEPGTGGGPKGDLFLKARLERHPDFTYEGTTVSSEIELWPWECALGASRTVTTPKGKVRLKIPPGTTDETTFRVPNHGLPRGDGFGTFLGIAKIQIPGEVSDEERKHWEALAALHGD